MVSELVHDWCFITTVFLHYFYRTDLTTSTVPAAHDLVTSVACHSVTEPRLRYSSTVVGWIPPRFLVSPSRSHSNRDVHLLRPGRARAIDVRRPSPRCTTPRQSVNLGDIFTEQFELSHLSVRALSVVTVSSPEAQHRTV